MSEFNCGNCRHMIEAIAHKGAMVTVLKCGEDISRTLEVEWDDYCSKHLDVRLYDKQMHEKYTRANNTLLGY